VCRSKSSRVGPATASDGARTTAYHASVPLMCAQCTGAILPGDVFSRRSQRVIRAVMGAVTMVPTCVTCRPVRVDGDVGSAAPAALAEDKETVQL